MRELLHETPFGYAILGVAALGVLAALAVLVLGVRRGRRLRPLRAAVLRGEASAPQRFSRLPEWIAACAPVVVLAMIVASISSGRSRLLSGARAEDAKAAWRAFAGLGEQLSAVMLGGPLLAALLPLAAAALAVCLGHRAAARSVGRAVGAQEAFGPQAPEVRAWIEHPLPDPRLLRYVVVGAGLALGAGAFMLSLWASQLLRAFAGVAGVDPAVKAHLLELGIAEARPTLDGLLLPGVVAALALAAAAFAPVLLPARRRRALAPSLAAIPLLSWRAVRSTVLVCAAISVAAVTLGLRYRAENVHPVPAAVRGTTRWLGGVQTPALFGPDSVPWAPVLAIERDRLRLEDAAIPAERLAEELAIHHNNYRITHPNAAGSAELVVQADRRLLGSALRAPLQLALREGYARIVLALADETVVLERPLLGRFTRRRTTGARVSLAWSGADPGRRPGAIPLAAALPLAALAERAVSARRAGRTPVLELPPLR